MRALSFRERMREEAAKTAAAEIVDPWRLRLSRVRGKVDFYDRLERISSQTLLDLLEIPQRNRTAGTCRRLAKVMAELGWTAVRVRDLTRGGYKEQVRGYCREARSPYPTRIWQGRFVSGDGQLVGVGACSARTRCGARCA
jgi:hypothetical protein